MTKRQPPLDENKKVQARRLRHDATTPERLLWGQLRNGRLLGLKFRRQEPIDAYVADFVCRSTMLTIEIDGDSHIGRAAYDRQRASNIEAAGYRILRVGNDDVLNDMDGVLAAIIKACGLDPESRANQTLLPPREGEVR